MKYLSCMPKKKLIMLLIATVGLDLSFTHADNGDQEGEHKIETPDTSPTASAQAQAATNSAPVHPEEKPRAADSTDKGADTSPKIFLPSEDISEDATIAFPVDI
ncbi:MAG: hypothetical protein KUG75_06745 [Pseudomonadales bacterium]|nr:hypothetical protein [Pseudomonadales bacterium]